MHLGDWQLDGISGGTFLIDGGVMFGVVPRTLWSNIATPDALNRVPCASRCLLARNGRQTVLVDTGYGGKYGPLDRKFYGMEPGEPLLESLASLGVTPEDVNVVVLSHLHFDHAGGSTRYDPERRLVTTFPRARHFVGRIEWEDATGQSAELHTAYCPDNLQPLEASGRLVLVDDNAEDLARAAGVLDRGAYAGASRLAVRVGRAGGPVHQRLLPDHRPRAADVAHGLRHLPRRNPPPQAARPRRGGRSQLVGAVVS